MANTTEIANLEREIGIPPWQGITSSQPPQSKETELNQWLLVQGITHFRITKMSWDTKVKCYTIHKYFEKVVNNKQATWQYDNSLHNILDDLPKTPSPPSSAADRRLYCGDCTTPNECKFGKCKKGKPIPPVDDIPQTTYTPDQSNSIVAGAIKAIQEINQKITSYGDAIAQINAVVGNINRNAATAETRISAAVHSQLHGDIANGKLEIKPDDNLKQKILKLVEDNVEMLVLQHYHIPITSQPIISTSNDDDNPQLPLPAILEHTTELNSDLIPKIDPDFEFDPEATQLIHLAMKLNYNFFIQGPAGCGKTALPQQICARLHRPIKRFNLNGDVTVHDFLGHPELKSGETGFVYGVLPLAMKHGWLLQLDEVDYCPPHIAAILNPVGEHQGKLYIPHTGETITPHPSFLMGATANTGGKGDNTGMFTGTQVLNLAFLDRYPIRINMDYIPSDKEINMLIKRFPHHEIAEIENLVALASEIRSGFKNHNLSITLSTRKLIDYFTLRAQNLSIAKSLKPILTNWLDEDDLPVVMAIITQLGLVKEDAENSSW